MKLKDCGLNDRDFKIAVIFKNSMRFKKNSVRYKKTKKGSSISSGIKNNEQKEYFTKEIETTQKNQTNSGVEELNK